MEIWLMYVLCEHVVDGYWQNPLYLYREHHFFFDMPPLGLTWTCICVIAGLNPNKAIEGHVDAE